MGTNKQKRSFSEALKYYADRYFIKAMGAMAKGIFASLLIGTILAQFARIPWAPLQTFLNFVVSVCQNGYVIGGAIGAAIALALGAKTFTLCSAVVVGAIGYMSGAGGAGPVGAYVAAIVGIEFGRLVEGKTKVDIIVVPLVCLMTGGLVGYLLGGPLGTFMRWLGEKIGMATYMAPIPMGIIVSAALGLILTAPISSAAVAAMIFVIAEGTDPNTAEGIRLAAGAATIGCCCHMVGFAVASFRENKWGGVVSQGLGTSMLQVPNVLRHPQILIPPVVASVILGPLGTTVFQMKNIGISGGMGTCGLVGQIGTFTTMLAEGTPWWVILLKVLLLHIVAPALIALGTSELMRKLGWIKKGDMLLD
ncbi:MAG: PTS sugar transporter subunit IIC [Clostridia bacterium]|nr:PTS sugar transporter subunit IIC [Clostridia bacterium]MBQ2111359.1 PTS sugar transporter subunit IIC [Clostridia bacterium]